MIGPISRRFAFAAVFTAVVCGCGAQPARFSRPSLQGAARALDALGTLPQDDAPAKEPAVCKGESKFEPKQTHARDLLARIDRYVVEERAGENAERAWFDLYTDYLGISKEETRAVVDTRTGESLNMLSLVAVLPEPAHWPAMRVEAHRRAKESAETRATDEHMTALAFGLFFDSLLNDAVAQGKALDALQAAATISSKERREQAQPIIIEWRKHLAIEAGTDDPLAELIKEVDEGNPEAECCTMLDSLISKVGETRAKAFLAHALFERRVQLGLVGDDGTLELAQQLAMEQPARLGRVQWGLVGGARALELFYAMDALAECRERGCTQTPADFDRALDRAPRFVRGRLLRPLIEAAEDKHAERLLLEAADVRSVSFDLTETLQSLVNRGRGQRALDFARFLLERHPETSYWSGLNAFAYATDQRLAAQAYEILCAAPAGTADLEETRMLLSRSIVTDSKAGDDVATTAQRLQQRLALPLAGQTSERFYDDPRLARAEAAEQLADLGLLEQRREWLDEGLAAVEKILAETRVDAYGEENDRGDYARNRALTDSVRLLRESDRSSEAEKLLFDEFAAIGAACRATDLTGCRDRFTNKYSGRNTDVAARLLMALYASAGKDDEVRAIADRYPLWLADDVAGLSVGESCDCGGHPGVAIARLLVVTGDVARAKNLLRTILQGYDATPEAARLLGRVAGSPAIQMALQTHPQERGQRLAIASLAAAGAGEITRARQLALAARSETLYAPWRDELDAVLVDAAVADGDLAAAARWREGVQAHTLATRASRYEQLGITSKAGSLYAASIAKQQPGDCIENGMLDFSRKRGYSVQVSLLLRRMAADAGADASGGGIGCLKGYLSLKPEEYAVLRSGLVDAANTSPILTSALPALIEKLDQDCDLSSSVDRNQICVDAVRKIADQRAAYTAAKRQIEKDPGDADTLSALNDFTRRSAFASLYGGHMDAQPPSPAIDVDARERDEWALRLTKAGPSRLPNGIDRQRGGMKSYWSPIVYLADYWRAVFDAAQNPPSKVDLPAYPLAAARDYGKRVTDDTLFAEIEQAERTRPIDPAIRAGLAVGSTEVVIMAVRLIEPGLHDPCTMCL